MNAASDTQLPTLRELSASPLARDREEFLRRYASPVLMLPPGAHSGSGKHRDNKATDRQVAVWVGFKAGTDTPGSPASMKVFVNRAAIHAGNGIVCPIAKRTVEMPKWISIGRSATSDLVLEADTVSRIQGCFTEGPNGSWSFLDAASTNGVWHNGERIRPRRVVDLADGDELLLGPEVPAVFKTPHGLFEALAVLARHEDNRRGPATESGTPPDRNHLSS